MQAIPQIPSSSKSLPASYILSDPIVSKARENACKSPQSGAELISDSSFKDAVVTIRRAGIEFQYQLVVTRAYEEGEEQLLEEDAESEYKVNLCRYSLFM